MINDDDFVVLASLRRALRKFVRLTEEQARVEGITPQQYQVLLAIKGQPDRDWVSISDLAESLQLKHHAMVGLVDRCQTAGLVQRGSDPNDGRVVRVSLTQSGHDLLVRVAEKNKDELKAAPEITRTLASLGCE